MYCHVLGLCGQAFPKKRKVCQKSAKKNKSSISCITYAGMKKYLSNDLSYYVDISHVINVSEELQNNGDTLGKRFQESPGIPKVC